VRGRSRHPIIWAVWQKFQIRALRLCVQQFHLLPLISDTNPDDQHVSPQGTHFFPSFHFFNCAPSWIISQTKLVNQVYTPFLRRQISRDVLLSTDLYLVSKVMKDWSYTSTPHGQMKTFKNFDRSVWCKWIWYGSANFQRSPKVNAPNPTLTKCCAYSCTQQGLDHYFPHFRGFHWLAVI